MYNYKEQKFNTQKQLFDFLVENKSTLIAEKKYIIKHSDAIAMPAERLEKGEADKAISDPSTFDGNSLRVKSVINTTGLMDSHSDVHIKGLWTKSLRENKNLYLLQEHQMKFDSIISDNVRASAKEMTWKELGFNKEGNTQALVFDSTISKDRNKFMFDQYLNGYVKNHSVGMQYVKIDMAINDKDFGDEFGIWEKYIDQVANKQDAVNQGYFWAVTEAKAIEGSAVVMGSNQITPTLSVNEKQEPLEDTPKEEPVISTQKNIDIINNFKFKF